MVCETTVNVIDFVEIQQTLYVLYLVSLRLPYITEGCFKEEKSES